MRATLTRAERREQTRADLVASADRLFTARGFHATSLDLIADDAGYTKGAVYSNFDSKEDLFFAVYERRVEAGVADLERRLAEAPDFPTATERLAADSLARRGRDDGWLAVFFEFWAHVLRHRELRARFAALHAAALAPLVGGLGSHWADLPEDPEKLGAAMYAMQVGLSLEHLTRPDVIDADLGARMARLMTDDLDRRSRR